MTRIEWGQIEDRKYEIGLDRGVLYVGEDSGVPWNGLVSVDQQPTGGEPFVSYIDGVKFLNYASHEEFEFQISAFYSPKEFDVCDGALEIEPGFHGFQMTRTPFGLTYRTLIGDAKDGTDAGYKIHIIYNALASPANVVSSTLSSDSNPETLTWKATTTPVAIDGKLSSAHYVLNSLDTDSVAFSRIEDILYGTPTTAPRLPTPQEILLILTDDTITVIDNGDGSFTIIGPDSVVDFIDDGVFFFTSTRVFSNLDGSYTISTN